MAAPKENKFYKQRSKTGRARLFASPDALFKAAVKYFVHCDENPWVKVDFKGKDAKKVELPTERPYTLKGLCLFLGVGYNYFTQFEASLKDKIKPGTENYDPAAVEFSETIATIRDIIYTQKLEGALVGAFNANIVARELGLVDKSSMDVNYDKMSEADIDKVIERLTNKAENE